MAWLVVPLLIPAAVAVLQPNRLPPAILVGRRLETGLGRLLREPAPWRQQQLTLKNSLPLLSCSVGLRAVERKRGTLLLCSLLELCSSMLSSLPATSEAGEDEFAAGREAFLTEARHRKCLEAHSESGHEFLLYCRG